MSAESAWLSCPPFVPGVGWQSVLLKGEEAASGAAEASGPDMTIKVRDLSQVRSPGASLKQWPPKVGLGPGRDKYCLPTLPGFSLLTSFLVGNQTGFPEIWEWIKMPFGNQTPDKISNRSIWIFSEHPFACSYVNDRPCGVTEANLTILS